MTVSPTGDSFVFHASSVDDKDPYTVAMLENDGNGACSCRDFQCRCQPRWNKTGKVEEYGSVNRTRCKHINAVIMFLGNAVVANAKAS
jgi:hypothetical protein